MSQATTINYNLCYAEVVDSEVDIYSQDGDWLETWSFPLSRGKKAILSGLVDRAPQS